MYARRRGSRPGSRGKPDSHDICFIANGDTAGFLEQRLGHRVGDIVDVTGAKVGEHRGSAPIHDRAAAWSTARHAAPDGEPRFVLAITPATNTITVGPRDALAVGGMSAIRPNWTNQPPGAEWSGAVQVRAHGSPMAATVQAYDDGLEVALDTATHGVAPGQAVVLYEARRSSGARPLATAREQHLAPPGTTTDPDHRHRLLAWHRHGRCGQDRLRGVP